MKDPRYDAVGSSTLREELFNTFLKALSSGSLSTDSAIAPSSSSLNPSSPTPTAPRPEKDSSRQARAAAALATRSLQAQSQLSKINKDISQSKHALQSSEAELVLVSFYTDVVRDVGAQFGDVERLFGKGAHHNDDASEVKEKEEGEEAAFRPGASGGGEDKRYSESPLPHAQKRALFNKHITHLREKYRSALHALFKSAVMPHPETAGGGELVGIGLEKKWDDLNEDAKKGLEESLPALKLGLAPSSSSRDDADRRHRDERQRESSLEHEFTHWQQERTTLARTDFQKLLEENSFIEFWGKVGKSSKSKSGADGDDEENGSDDEDAGKRGFAVTMGEEDLGMDLDAEGDVGGAGGGGEEDDQGIGGKDLKSLARSIGLAEVERVLKVSFTYALSVK